MKLPTFLKSINYRNPTDPQHGNLQFTRNTDLPLFPYLMENPHMLSNFLQMLEGWRAGRTEWFDIFPVQEALFQGFKDGKDQTLLVDVGGGFGYDLGEFVKRFGQAMPGKVVLQDLPPVIQGIKGVDERIVPMEYDFFTPQPVKGEVADYLRP